MNLLDDPSYTGGTGSHSAGDFTYHLGSIADCPLCNPRAQARWKCPDCGGWVDSSVGVHYCPTPHQTYPNPYVQMRDCPCRTENGGSGICGCTLSNPVITCNSTDLDPGLTFTTY